MGKHGHKIGLLGGSFNPAHEGHLHISKEALRLLGLDEVWWLVSPQNPLKGTDETADYDGRIAQAKTIATGASINVSDVENSLCKDSGKQPYTIYTLQHIIKEHPEDHFVWLMGADNLIQIPQWHAWEAIFQTIPIAIFDRDNNAEAALQGQAATIFSDYRFNEEDAPLLASSPAPAWVYLWIDKHPLSSTEVRNR